MQYLPKSEGVQFSLLLGPLISATDGLTPIENMTLGDFNWLSFNKPDGTTVDLTVGSSLVHKNAGVYLLTNDGSANPLSQYGNAILHATGVNAGYEMMPFQKDVMIVDPFTYADMVSGDAVRRLKGTIFVPKTVDGESVRIIVGPFMRPNGQPAIGYAPGFFDYIWFTDDQGNIVDIATANSAFDEINPTQFPGYYSLELSFGGMFPASPFTGAKNGLLRIDLLDDGNGKPIPFIKDVYIEDLTENLSNTTAQVMADSSNISLVKQSTSGLNGAAMRGTDGVGSIKCDIISAGGTAVHKISATIKDIEVRDDNVYLSYRDPADGKMKVYARPFVQDIIIASGGDLT